VAAQKTLNARRWTDVGFGMLHLSNKQRYERVGSRLSLDTDSSDSLQDFSANAALELPLERSEGGQLQALVGLSRCAADSNLL
jgi:hypothetical protein